MAGSRDDRSDEQRRIRAIIRRVFKQHGLALPKSLADPAEGYEPELTPPPPPPPPATPGEPGKIWLGTFEISPDVGALMIPADVTIEDAADAILEHSFLEAERHRLQSLAPEPPPPVLRDIEEPSP
jgi:hypothetical protein